MEFETTSAVTALCGPSGSGKTTVLSSIAGLLKPDRGVVQLGNRIVLHTENGVCLPPEKRGVGLLFQDHYLFPHLKVHANIAYGLRRRSGDQALVDRVIKRLELDELLDRYPRSLSGGQQQRVALARAIASAPRFLLLDEPLTAVEAPLREQIAGFIEQIVHEFEIPVLLVSHNRSLVDRLASQIIHMENGGIAEAVT